MKGTLTLENGKVLNVELTEEEAKKVESRVWKPEEGDMVFCAHNFGIETYYKRKGDERDFFDMGLSFKTSEEAYNEYERLCTIKRVKDYQIEHFGEFVPNWNDIHEYKWCVIYNHLVPEFTVDHWNTRSDAVSIPYMGKESDADQLISDCEADLKIIFGIK